MNTATAASQRQVPRAYRESVFPSRVDAWLAATVVLAIGICFFLAWQLGSVLALVIGGFNLLVVLLLTTPCRYTLGADHLDIRCGLIKKRIPYAQIHRIEPSSSALSAPALSLRRVKISYGRAFQLISPRCRDRFIAELSMRTSLDR